MSQNITTIQQLYSFTTGGSGVLALNKNIFLQKFLFV